MTWSMAPFARRFTALSILLIILSVLFLLGEEIIIDPLRSRSEDVAILSEQLANVKASQNSGALIARRQSEAERALSSLNISWSGPTRPQIAASIQDVLRVAAQQSEGRMVTTSVLEAPGKDENITVRARIDGPLTSLQSVLTVIEQSRPRLFVKSLVVNAVSPASSPTQRQLLSFELSIDAYVAVNDHTTH